MRPPKAKTLDLPGDLRPWKRRPETMTPLILFLFLAGNIQLRSFSNSDKACNQTVVTKTKTGIRRPENEVPLIFYIFTLVFVFLCYNRLFHCIFLAGITTNYGYYNWCGCGSLKTMMWDKAILITRNIQLFVRQINAFFRFFYLSKANCSLVPASPSLLPAQIQTISTAVHFPWIELLAFLLQHASTYFHIETPSINLWLRALTCNHWYRSCRENRIITKTEVNKPNVLHSANISFLWALISALNWNLACVNVIPKSMSRWILEIDDNFPNDLL